MHVRFVIRALGHGGTERALVLMTAGLVPRGHRVGVVSFFPEDLVGDELRVAGAEVVCLGLRGRGDLLRAAVRGPRALLAGDPDVLYSFHAESDLLALAAGRLRPRTAVVWGLQTTDLARFGVDLPSRAAIALHERLGGQPDLVASCSRVALLEAAAAGYPTERLRLIENGIDVEAFRRDEPARERVRAELGLEPADVLVGCVARLAPAKDHPTFLQAAALVPGASFVCVGDGDPDYAAELRRLGAELGLDGRLRWLGVRADMAALHSALDVLVLAPSWAEGMPLAVGEAMAAGAIPVVSDQAEMPRLVGDAGVVVPRADPVALAAGIQRAIERSRSPRARSAAQARAAEAYSAEGLVAGTEAMLAEAIARRGTIGRAMGRRRTR